MFSVSESSHILIKDRLVGITNALGKNRPRSHGQVEHIAMDLGIDIKSMCILDLTKVLFLPHDLPSPFEASLTTYSSLESVHQRSYSESLI